MKFLENWLRDRCLSCNICCRFPEKNSPLIPFFLNKEIRDKKYFHCIGIYYGYRINVIKSNTGYHCPYFLTDKNICSTYANRPIDCRLYPFMITYDNNYKKVVLVLDNNCPYSHELVQFGEETKSFIDSIELTQQNLGLINDPQSNTIFVEELPKMAEFVFGKSGTFKKIFLEDRNMFNSFSKGSANYIFTTLYLWKDIMNIIWKIDENTLQVFYGIDNIFQKLPLESQEYIYLKRDLEGLKGNRYKDKRNLCNHFQNNYKYTIDKISSPQDKIDEYLSLYKQWAERKIVKNKSPYYQRLIEDSSFFHRRAFMDFTKLGLEGIEIKVEDKLIAYTFGSALKNDTFYILGEITNSNYKGINQFIFREFCKMIPGNYIYINTMDDSEIEGLRRNKLSYHPTETI